jgi:predicted tellurium resistance membrane protein TerC
MFQDKVLIAGLFGVLSTIPAEIVSRILVYFRFGKYSIYELASLTITFNRPVFIIGLIVDLLVSSLLSVILYLIFEKFGSTHLVIKTAVCSLLAWLGCELLFTAIIEGKYIRIRPLNDYYSHIISTLIFGLTLGLLLKKYIFNKLTT